METKWIAATTQRSRKRKNKKRTCASLPLANFVLLAVGQYLGLVVLLLVAQ